MPEEQLDWSKSKTFLVHFIKSLCNPAHRNLDPKTSFTPKFNPLFLIIHSIINIHPYYALHIRCFYRSQCIAVYSRKVILLFTSAKSAP